MTPDPPPAVNWVSVGCRVCGRPMLAHRRDDALACMFLALCRAGD